MAGDMRWIGSWAASPVVTEGLAFGNQTLRMIARASIGGKSLRVRLSNAYGLRKLVLGGARIALRDKDERIVPGSDRKLTFSGADGVAIAAGALAVSDEVALDLPPLADLAVSIYVPGALPESFQITGHGNAHQTNYVSPRAITRRRRRCRSRRRRIIGISSPASTCWRRARPAASSRSAIH